MSSTNFHVPFESIHVLVPSGFENVIVLCRFLDCFLGDLDDVRTSIKKARRAAALMYAQYKNELESGRVPDELYRLSHDDNLKDLRDEAQGVNIPELASQGVWGDHVHQRAITNTVAHENDWGMNLNSP